MTTTQIPAAAHPESTPWPSEAAAATEAGAPDAAGDVTAATDHTGAEATPDLEDEPATPAATVPAASEPDLVHVDPATLIIDANVREHAALGKAFVGTVRDHGVLVPISARRGVDGGLRVLLGQRRTRAAVEAGLSSIPVYVVEAPDEEKALEIARILEQVIENDHRAALPEADRAAAHQQLSLLGLSAGQIARRTRTPVKAVRTSLAVSGSELAAAAMRRYSLTLEQAAALAEFEGDAEAVEALTATATQEPTQFDHVAQRLRDERAAAAAKAAVAAELAAGGLAVIDDPGHGDRTSRIRPLSRLKAAGQPDGSELTVEEHATCPGHAAYVTDRWRWDGEHYEQVYVCTDWQTHGHLDRYAATDARSQASTGRPSGGMTEQEKAGRRAVIANNKAWDSAEKVRRDWLSTFCARKSAPKDAAAWTASTLAESSHDLRRAMEEGHPLACALLGVERGAWTSWNGQQHPISALAATATPARSGMLTLALVLACVEATLDRHTWRTPSRTARSYLRTLEAWGYPLSEVEQLVTAEPVRPDPDPEGEAPGSAAGDGVADVGGPADEVADPIQERPAA